MQLKPNGGVLKWAREVERRSIEEISSQLSITPEELKKWENNENSISQTYLRKLSAIYQRPISFFFAHKVPTAQLFTPEFRTLDSVQIEKLSEKAILALRKTKYNRRLYTQILDRLDEPYKLNFPKISISSDPEKVANNIRNLLEVPDLVHKKLKNKSSALRYWTSSIEKNGILIFQYSLPEGERGFCLEGESELPPVIVLRSGEEPAGRIFTIFHELSHILLKERSSKISYKKLEQFCNHFAGAFLVPKDTLLQSSNYEKYVEELSDYWLSRLCGEFKVSDEVILRRLLILKKIRESFYNKKIAEIKVERAKRKKVEEEKQDDDGFLAPAKKSFMNLGIRMSGKLFEAYERGVIGNAELVRNFQTTSHTLPNIKQELTASQKIYAD